MKTMFIEGVDCTGKTSLINALTAEKTDVFTHHYEYPLGATDQDKYYFQYGQFEEMFRKLDELNRLHLPKTQYIFDRSHIGEYVWGPYYRKKFPIYLPTIEHNFFEKWGHNTETILLFCSDLSKISDRFAERDEDIPKDWEHIQDMFLTAVQDISPFSFRIFDTAVLTTEEIVKKITKG